jgi:hypothetical protein
MFCMGNLLMILMYPFYESVGLSHPRQRLRIGMAALNEFPAGIKVQ